MVNEHKQPPFHSTSTLMVKQMISVVVPVYNTEKYLNECLESLNEQTDPVFEIVLVDDGSTDSSGGICDTFASHRPNCKVVHTENQGLLLARRLGMSLTTGDYILNLDSDDCLRNDTVSRIKEIIQSFHPDLICFDFSRGLNKTFSGVIIPCGLNKSDFFNENDLGEIKSATCLGKFNSIANKAIKKDVIDLEEDYSNYAGLMHGEDWLQTIAFINNIESAYYLKEPLYFYRESSASSTYAYKPSQLADLSRVFERLNRYTKAWGSKYQELGYQGICMHCFWLIQGISKLDNWHDNAFIIADICAVMEKYCRENLQNSIKQLRIDFCLVLQLALAKKPLFAMALARLELIFYKIISRKFPRS